MKIISLSLLILVFCTQNIHAQKPEKIVSFAKIPKSHSYYNSQALLWEKEIKKKKRNAPAWMNFYFAKRFTFIHAEKKNPLAEKTTLDSIVTQMEKNISNSFEYNYVKYRQSGLNLDYLPYLEKAYKLNPERTETYSDLVACYEATRNISQRDMFAKRMYEKTDPSPGILNYNYNVMSGLEENTILITAGDNDTYPVWMLQNFMNFRKDIVVLNKSLLLIDSYRNKIFNEFGIDTTGLKVPWEWSKENLDRYEVDLVKRIAANSQKRPLALALTAGAEYPKELKDNLYLTGLALKYSPERIDNIALIKRNFDQNYALDYLNVNFAPDVSAELVKHSNQNYIVPMLSLYEHYKISGETAKAEKIKSLAQVVGKGTKQEEKLNNYFSK